MTFNSPSLRRIHLPTWTGSLLPLLSAASLLAPPHSTAANPQVTPPTTAAPTPTAPRPGAGALYIAEYRVLGSHLLNEEAIGEAVYPFLGPGRTAADVEGARSALERAYHEKGLQTVSVSIPAQTGRHGILFLQDTEVN